MTTRALESLAIFKTVVDEGGVVRATEKMNRVPSNVTTRVCQRVAISDLGVACVERLQQTEIGRGETPAARQRSLHAACGRAFRLYRYVDRWQRGDLGIDLLRHRALEIGLDDPVPSPR